LGILHFFYSIVGNYGLAIIMLTVLVRLCMVPISRKQAQSMVKMQELKPELDKLKDKYKGDPTKQSQAMQELYRKHNINPLAGCLPMFIQLPIFIGLYRSLAVDVELRQAPLISDAVHWCSNLAAPDMLLNWSSFMPASVNSGIGFLGLGPYLNVLPLVTVALFIAQQKILMPEPANEQAAMQQNMMKYMMIFFAFMFYKVASGLCIYFIASSIWGITERKLMPMPTAATASGATGGTAAAKSTTSTPRIDRSKKKR
jgi:YidC/Oxa1 family membrane protein insertase